MPGPLAELSFVLRLMRSEAEFALDGAIPLEGVTAIVGPSGSGKTTLLMMLAGLEPDARGEILCDGEPWLSGQRSVPPEARRVGMVFQDGRLFDHLSVAENVSYGARRRDIAPAAVEGIVDGMGLRPLLHRRLPTLSGGEARRVAVARALASGPRMLFMDEPLSALDDEAKARILPYIARAVTGSGLPVVYVTHSRAEVAQFADRILRIEAGRVAGWDRPPVTLDVVVEAAERGRVLVALGPARLVLAGQGAPGDARRIVLLPTGTLLSRDPPGPSDALGAVPVEVAAARRRPRAVDLLLEIEGQSIAWSVSAESELGQRPPGPDERLWLTLFEAHLR